MRSYRSLAACMLTGLSAAQPALAQIPAANWPTKPVMVVIPYVAGGSTENELRLYTERLQAQTGQPFVFDFRGGAASTIGTGVVLKAAPDGYSWLVTNAALTMLPNFYPTYNHAVVSTLNPVTELSSRTTAIIASVTGLPKVNNLKDLVAYAKANPGKLSCNTTGTGAASHIICASLANTTGIEILPVHYKGVAQGQIDLIAGRTQVSSGSLLAAIGQVKAGKLKLLAITGPKRSPLLPDIATTFEQGYALDYPAWLGWFGPPKTPPAIINRMNAELVKVLRTPEVIAGLEKLGSAPEGNSPEQFRKKFLSELVTWKKVVEDNKIEASEN